MKPIRWSAHALVNIAKREIGQTEVERTVRAPDSIAPAQPPRQFRQRRYMDEILNEEMLLRVLVEETDAEIAVVTLYKTSKFKKYETGEPR